MIRKSENIIRFGYIHKKVISWSTINPLTEAITFDFELQIVKVFTIQPSFYDSIKIILSIHYQE